MSDELNRREFLGGLAALPWLDNHDRLSVTAIISGSRATFYDGHGKQIFAQELDEGVMRLLKGLTSQAGNTVVLQ